MLVAPLFLFLDNHIRISIGDMLFRSVDDRMITENVTKYFYSDLKNGMVKIYQMKLVMKHFIRFSYPLSNKTKSQVKLYQRLNYEKSGFSSGLKKDK